MLKTLLDFAGVRAAAGTLGESVLLIIDAQNEYYTGEMPLQGIVKAVAEIESLLNRARRVGAPVIHVVHHSKPGAAIFDPEKPNSKIIEKLAPAEGEKVVVKTLPSGFTGTSLKEEIDATGRNSLIVAGFMTHMCVSSTVRAACELGYKVTVVSSACSARDLPMADGDIVSSQVLHSAELAALRDRFAMIVGEAKDIR